MTIFIRELEENKGGVRSRDDYLEDIKWNALGKLTIDRALKIIWICISGMVEALLKYLILVNYGKGTQC